MKSFFQYCVDNKIELPVGEAEAGDAVDENTKRAGIMKWAYPDAYVRSQYPDLNFAPIAADHAQKLGK